MKKCSCLFLLGLSACAHTVAARFEGEAPRLAQVGRGSSCGTEREAATSAFLMDIIAEDSAPATYDDIARNSEAWETRDLAIRALGMLAYQRIDPVPTLQRLAVDTNVPLGTRGMAFVELQKLDRGVGLAAASILASRPNLWLAQRAIWALGSDETHVLDRTLSLYSSPDDAELHDLIERAIPPETSDLRE